MVYGTKWGDAGQPTRGLLLTTPVEEWRLQGHKHLSFKVIKMRKETICQTWRLEFSTECKSELETLGFFDSVNSSRSSSGSRDYQLLEMSYAGLLIFCFILITILSIMYYYAHFKQKNQKLIANQLTGSGFKVRCV